jgi:hypothetical protein
MTYTPNKNDIVYIFPPFTCISFFAKKLIDSYKNNKFCLVFHLTNEMPIFAAFMPKTVKMKKFEQITGEKTLIPSHKNEHTEGYYKSNPLKNLTTMILYNDI